MRDNSADSSGGTHTKGMGSTENMEAKHTTDNNQRNKNNDSYRTCIFIFYTIERNAKLPLMISFTIGGAADYFVINGLPLFVFFPINKAKSDAQIVFPVN